MSHWILDENGTISADGKHIATVHDGYPQHLKTGRLIAAAPDLLEALDKVLSAMKMQEGRQDESFHIPAHTAEFIWHGAKSMARAAIAKATSSD